MTPRRAILHGVGVGLLQRQQAVQPDRRSIGRGSDRGGVQGSVVPNLEAAGRPRRRGRFRAMAGWPKAAIMLMTCPIFLTHAANPAEPAAADARIR